MKKMYIYEKNGNLKLISDKKGHLNFFKGIKIYEDISILMPFEILRTIINDSSDFETIDEDEEEEFNKDLNEYNRTTSKQQEEELLNLGMKILK